MTHGCYSEDVCSWIVTSVWPFLKHFSLTSVKNTKKKKLKTTIDHTALTSEKWGTFSFVFITAYSKMKPWKNFAYRQPALDITAVIKLLIIYSLRIVNKNIIWLQTKLGGGVSKESQDLCGPIRNKWPTEPHCPLQASQSSIPPFIKKWCWYQTLHVEIV